MQNQSEQLSSETRTQFVSEHFVDRDEILDELQEWATQFPKQSASTHALIGRRRTGKTSILMKLYEYLFYKQQTVLPVFITFEDFLLREGPISTLEYIETFLGGYIASYAAFRLRQPELLTIANKWDRLREIVEPQADDLLQELYQRFDRLVVDNDANRLASFARGLPTDPTWYAQQKKMPTIVIIDEFQMVTQVHHPVLDRIRSMTGAYVSAVESLVAPMLVSGSAVSLLVNRALADGLSGRIGGFYYVDPLPQKYTHDLVFRLAAEYKLKADEAFAEMVWKVTKGYPYSVYCLMATKSPERKKYPNLDALNKVVEFELTNSRGQLWHHYGSEFAKYSEELNDGLTTRKVMFWATKYPKKRIDVKQIAKTIGETEATVRASLEKLQWVDIVMRVGLRSHEGPSDPMLRRFIEYEYYLEIEELSPKEALKDWHQEFLSLQGSVNKFVGHVAEGYVYAILSGFDGRTVQGKRYFNLDQDVILPPFTKIERRGGIVQKNKPFEMDLICEYALPNGGIGAWMVQVKYWKDPVGEKEIREFLDSVQRIANEKGYADVTRWYFCKQGYRAKAEAMLKQHGVLYSMLEEFNAFAKLFDFFGLPED
ncbi:MAG: hypothetical protein AAF639_23275 [Chloroflexota bacterium]